VSKRKETEILDFMIDEYLDQHPDESPDGMLVEVQNRLAHLNHTGQKKDKRSVPTTEYLTNEATPTNSNGSSDHNNSFESNTPTSMVLK
jgi:hypothetical protein